MNNFEEITKNPETLGAFLRGLPVIEAPWDEEFQRKYCAGCGKVSCDDGISFIIDPNVVTATKKDIADHDASKTAHAAEFEKKADVTDLNAHANNTDIHVNPSTMGNYDTAISGLIEHKEDTKIHVTAEEKASWTEGAEQAAADANRVTEALNAIAGIESRVSRVEDGLFNNITGNPFLASFDSLDGITLVKGIWNEERKRIEC